MKQENSNIIKFPKQFQLNIGIVIFVIIFIYVVFHIFSYLTADTITVYEVSQGTLAANHEYHALAIRAEEVVLAQEEGAVVYCSPNLNRAGARTLVCAVDSSGSIASQLSDTSADITDIGIRDAQNITGDVRAFANDFNVDNFSRVYGFKTDIASRLEQTYSRQALEQFSDQIAAGTANGTFHAYYGMVPGVVVYGIDGLEHVTLDNFSNESLDASSLKTTDLKAQDNVLKGQALYKVITSDHWNLVMEIDQELAKELENENFIEIRFFQDNARTWASYTIETRAEHTYLILSLDDSVERYGDSRFVRIELLLNEETGLKIPNSAITSKRFFAIPKSYFYQGNDSTTLGVMVEGEEDTSSFVTPTLFYETEDAYYVDEEHLKDGDILLKPDSNHTYQVGSDIDDLQGVYNINKGYAVFKQIEVLYQNEDYAIVRTGTPYGISLYDHIALQGDAVKENDLIQ